MGEGGPRYLKQTTDSEFPRTFDVSPKEGIIFYLVMGAVCLWGLKLFGVVLCWTLFCIYCVQMLSTRHD